MRCNICLNDLSDFKNYIFHLKFYHNITDYFACPYMDCDRTYNNKRSFKRHLELKHTCENNPVCNSVTPTVTDLSLPNFLSHDKLHTLENSANVSNQLNSERDTFDVKVKQHVDDFVSKLYDRLSLSRLATQEIIASVGTLLTNISLDLKDEAQHSNAEATNIAIDSLSSCFSHVGTEYKRLQYFENTNKFVKPTQITIGSTQQKVNENNTAVMDLKDTFVCMVSLKQNLELFLTLQGVYDSIISYHEELANEQDVIRNIIQGEIWKNLHEKDSDVYLPLILFFDDLETGNPLGSHAGKNKIGAVYISIGSLPPEHSSKLENIFLVMLFKSHDRVTFGNKVIFEPVIRELNFLHEHGINIVVNETKISVKFTLVAIAGDNLGIHSIMGFNESFASTYYCRFCVSTKQQCQSQLTADESRSRVVETVDNENPIDNEQGIKEPCVWNNVQSFHVYDNLYCDVMHDICEGIHRYGMALIINKLIQEGCFTLEQLNDRIKFFDFNSSNPPPAVSKSHLQKGAIVFSASEMLCLVRHFQFLVGDLVPAGNEIWDYYLCMRDLTNVAMLQAFNTDLIHYLKNIVREHHERYVTLFEETLKPKHHFLIHYPEVIKKVGPLVLISAFKYESKHLDLKRISNSVNTQKNVPLTLAIKCQLQSCYRFINGRGLQNCFETGKVKGQQSITEAGSETIFMKVKWIKINGIKYRVGNFLLYDYEDFIPQFCKIHQILLTDDNSSDFYFYTLVYKTINYNEHLQSFSVNEDDKFNLLRLDDCYDSVPKKMYSIEGHDYICCFD